MRVVLSFQRQKVYIQRAFCFFPITNTQALIKNPSRKAHCPAGGIITYAKHTFRYTLSVFFALKWIFTPRSTHPLMSSNISQSSIILLSPVCGDFISRFAIASSIAVAVVPDTLVAVSSAVQPALMKSADFN